MHLRSILLLLKLIAVVGVIVTILAVISPFVGLGEQQGFFGYSLLGLSRSELARASFSIALASFAIILLLTNPSVAIDFRNEVKTAPVIKVAFTPHEYNYTYRPDIDGMRALAIIVVVSFHAFPNIVTGGFIGVDIFFVISGYLISSIIVLKLDKGTFSFGEFYYRRIRRIFPALIVVLVCCYLIGWYFLAPDEFKQLGKHIAGGAAFVSNLIFWREAGYFDNESKILLHLWSLGVEEQFYLVWPLILWTARKLGFNFFLTALCVAIPSFLVNIYYVMNNDLVSAFYSPASRFWELMLGAMLATVQVSSTQSLRSLQSLVGLAALYLAVVTITRTTAFPGFWVLLPTVGTALIIGAGPNSWFNRNVLSQPLLVGIGLISYPLYLWHLPLLTFPRIDEMGTPDVTIRLGAIVLSVVLAWATYYFIERPIRFGTLNKFSAGTVLGMTMFAVGLAGYITMRFDGLPFRTAAKAVKEGELWHEAFFQYQSDHSFLCTPDYIRNHSLTLGWPARCIQSKPSEIKDVAIIGDSHAEDLFVGLAESLSGLNVVNYIQGALPVLGQKEFNEIFDYVLHDRNIKTIILASYWGWRLNQVPKGSSLENELTKTVDALIRAGKTVYIIDDRPLFPFDPGACKYSRRRLYFWEAEREPRCNIERSEFNLQQSRYHAALVSVAMKLKNVHLLDTAGVFCNQNLCSMATGTRLLYRERNHLTVEGSRAVADHLMKQLATGSDSPLLGTAK